MPLVFQDYIMPTDIMDHPDWLYLFGDNEQRRGFKGQAAACRGYPNAVGIATKRAPHRGETAYWSEVDYDRAIAIIDRDLAQAFDHMKNGGTVVCPSAGLGTGLADLGRRAPRIFSHIRKRIKELRSLGESSAPSQQPDLDQ